MTSRNPSASNSFPPATTYRAPTTESFATESTVGGAADPDTTATTEGHARSASLHGKTLASIKPWRRVSRYCIKYSEAGGDHFDFHRLPSDLDQGPSHHEDHDETMRELVYKLNDGYSRDIHNSQHVVEVQVGKYNNKDSKTHFNLDEPKKCGGTNPAWSASITVESETAALHAAKTVVNKLSSVTKETARVLRGLRKRDHVEL